VWRSAVRLDPDWGLLWNNVGLIYFDRQNTLRAIKMFELASRHDPEFKESRLNLAQFYAHKGLNEQAEKYYKEALTLDIGYVKAAVLLAQLWDREGKGAQAREFMREYARKFPAPRVIYLMGVFEEKDGDAEAALSYYSKAAAAAPFDPLPNLALPRLLAAKGKRGEALAHLEKFLTLYQVNDLYRQEAERMASKFVSRSPGYNPN